MPIRDHRALQRFWPAGSAPPPLALQRFWPAGSAPPPRALNNTSSTISTNQHQQHLQAPRNSQLALPISSLLSTPPSSTHSPTPSSSTYSDDMRRLRDVQQRAEEFVRTWYSKNVAGSDPGNSRPALQRSSLLSTPPSSTSPLTSADTYSKKLASSYSNHVACSGEADIQVFQDNLAYHSENVASIYSNNVASSGEADIRVLHDNMAHAHAENVASSLLTILHIRVLHDNLAHTHSEHVASSAFEHVAGSYSGDSKPALQRSSLSSTPPSSTSSLSPSADTYLENLASTYSNNVASSEEADMRVLHDNLAHAHSENVASSAFEHVAGSYSGDSQPALQRSGLSSTPPSSTSSLSPSADTYLGKLASTYSNNGASSGEADMQMLSYDLAHTHTENVTSSDSNKMASSYSGDSQPVLQRSSLSSTPPSSTSSPSPSADTYSEKLAGTYSNNVWRGRFAVLHYDLAQTHSENVANAYTNNVACSGEEDIQSNSESVARSSFNVDAPVCLPSIVNIDFSRKVNFLVKTLAAADRPAYVEELKHRIKTRQHIFAKGHEFSVEVMARALQVHFKHKSYTCKGGNSNITKK